MFVFEFEGVLFESHRRACIRTVIRITAEQDTTRSSQPLFLNQFYHFINYSK